MKCLLTQNVLLLAASERMKLKVKIWRHLSKMFQLKMESGKMTAGHLEMPMSIIRKHVIKTHQRYERMESPDKPDVENGSEHKPCVSFVKEIGKYFLWSMLCLIIVFGLAALYLYISHVLAR